MPKTKRRKLDDVILIKLSDMVTTDQLNSDQRITMAAIALEETAVMEALVLIHGKERGYDRYLGVGGHIVFDDDGEPAFVWRDRIEKNRAKSAGA